MPFDICFRRVAVVALVACSGVITATPDVAVSATLPASHAASFRGDDSLSYDRYRTPTHCNAALDRITRAYWRTTDTIARETMTTPVAGVTAAARRCGARFTPAGIDSLELAAFARLSFIAGQPEQARAAVDRLIGRSWTPESRARELLTLLRYYAELATVPKHDLDVLAEELDKLGAVGALARLQAYMLLGQRAKSDHDVPWLDSVVTRAGAALAQLSAVQRRQHIPLLYAYYTLDAYRSILTADGDSAVRVIRRGLAVLGTGSVQAANLGVLETSYQVLGTSASPIQAEFWFNTGTRGQVRPIAGTPTLLVYVQHDCYFVSDCGSGYAALRRLEPAASRANADVTLFTQTLGYFQMRPPMGPEEEAREDERHFLTELKLFGALAVTAPGYDTLADGRRKSLIDRNQRAYGIESFPSPTPIGILVDRMGLVRMIQSIDPTTERMWNAMLRSVQ